MKNFELNEHHLLTGALGARPSGVPSKFTVDGAVRPFPGNTIICHLSQDSELHTRLTQLALELDGCNNEALYTLLPPSSWHMTVFEGVCDQVRTPGFWPADLPADAPLAECNAAFSRKLSAFDMNTTPSFRMRISGYTPRVDGIGLHLEPVDTAEDARIRNLRDRLSKELQIRHPFHEEYGFHLSIAYFIRFPTDDERSALDKILFNRLQDMPTEFELAAPEFCFFDDMFEFRRQFFLK
ncbi:DUF1868 domain-containing protein [Rhizobium sp. NFACC06-2]|uniref:DUF1868 domain-containing protein n=1 Tax=Rhizobium sp. NFACC06-2 TaxID=1566264 RepID=UPI000876FB14|nr:DUF1868 domain-containing protein [Rhizobium sp. NFACC06-2]SCY91035.1 hypothetical protein SAMN03159288_05155 [Rhizobium sp. NFACC06-2]